METRSIRDALLAVVPTSCSEEGSNLLLVVDAMREKGFSPEEVTEGLKVLCASGEIQHNIGGIFVLGKYSTETSKEEVRA